jgi:hypothetical protein
MTRIVNLVSLSELNQIFFMRFSRSHNPGHGFDILTWVIFYAFLVLFFNIGLIEN